MLARFLATVAALLLACASPQAQAHVRAPERVSVSFADLAHDAAQENALPAKSASKPKTAPPARATLENPAPGKNATPSHWHVCKNWSPLPDCTVGSADDVWGVEKASTGLQSRLGHTGYLKDPLLSDELYAQARQYRAGIGRFTSRDEWAGDNQRPLSLNKYLAFLGNPGSIVDPDGRCPGPMTERECFEATAEAIGADIGTREGFQRTADVQAGVAKAQLGVGMLMAGGALGRVAFGAARTIFQAIQAGGFRYAATATMPEQILLAETGGGVAAAITGTELPPTPLSPIVQGAKVEVKALTNMASDVEAGLATAGAKLADDVPSAPSVVAQIVEAPNGSLAAKPSSMPDWLRQRFKEGEDFNRRQHAKYPYNEVYVENSCDSGACLRLDSYNPFGGADGAGEIVSRKYTQLSEINPETAINYMREIERKYGPGTVIADVPTNRANGLAGNKLRGQMYLEVPTQNAPVPKQLIDEARRRDIRIRDENGNEF